MKHGFIFYLVSLGLALFFSLVFLFFLPKIPFLRSYCRRRELDRREQYFPRYKRLGGAILIPILLLLLLIDPRLEWNGPFTALICGSILVGLFSLIDDVRPVPWVWHLLLQCLLGAIVFFSGMNIDLGFLSQHIPISRTLITFLSFGGTTLWIILIMNALNWSDGIDGLMPGITTIASATIFFLSLRWEVNQPTVAIIASVFLGLSLGLWYHNWYPARLFAGTVGAYLFSFGLSVLALYAGMKVATVMLVLAVPILDAFFVILRRLATHRSPFHPDETHLHHLLLRHGWSPATISTFYLSFTLFLSVGALVLQNERKLMAFLLVAFLLMIFSLSLSFLAQKSGKYPV